MCPRWATGTPTLPTSPRAMRRVGVVAGLRRQVEGDRQPGLALGQVGAVQRVRGGRRRVARVRAHQPRLVSHGIELRHDASVLTGHGVGPAGPTVRQSSRYSPRSPRPRRASEVRRRPLHVEQRSRPVSRSQLDEARRARPSRRRVGVWNIDSPAKKRSIAHAVEAADQLAVVVTRSRRCGPSRARAAAVGVDERRRDPAAVAARDRRSAVITSAKAVSTRTS